MIIGTNAHAPGLTVRWNDIGDDWASLFAPRLGSVLVIERRGDYEWAVHSFIRWEAHRDTITVPRRCDAKRAAEVLVGQWWREKCEREAKAREWQWRAVCRKAAEVRGIVTADYADGTSEQVEVTTDRAERTLSPLGQLFVNGIREDMFGTTKIRECVPEYGE